MATITETVRRPQVRQTSCFIGGKWVPAASGKTFETIHPATEEVICEVAEGDAEDVDAAVDAAREAFDSGPWSKMDARDRGILINRLADLIEEELSDRGDTSVSELSRSSATRGFDRSRPNNTTTSTPTPPLATSA